MNEVGIEANDAAAYNKVRAVITGSAIGYSSSTAAADRTWVLYGKDDT